MAKTTYLIPRAPKAPSPTSLALRNVATLIQTLPERLQTLTIKSESPRRKLSTGYGERHRQIFPGGFDSTSFSNSTKHSPYSFSPEQLYDILTNIYNPEHHVEHVIVKSASYCKQNTGPKHEFIILEVEDQKSPGLKNFIALDRNNGEVPARSSLISSSQSYAAKDEFRVSYDGNKRSLLVQCGLQDHETLETLEFKSEKPLMLYQLATLTRAVSLQRDRYNVITANCYWFAGLIWDCMIQMRPSAYRRVVQGHIRGAFHGWLRQNTNIAELEVTYEYVDKELLDMENRFSSQKQKWTHTRDNELREELEDAMKRIRELQEQINAASVPSRH